MFLEQIQKNGNNPSDTFGLTYPSIDRIEEVAVHNVNPFNVGARRFQEKNDSYEPVILPLARRRRPRPIELDSGEERHVVLHDAVRAIEQQRHAGAVRAPLPERLPQIRELVVRRSSPAPPRARLQAHKNSPTGARQHVRKHARGKQALADELGEGTARARGRRWRR